MPSLILTATSRTLQPLLILFSFFLLLRGHNEAGGGFVGGLVAASAFVLEGLARGPEAGRTALPGAPARLFALGIAISLGSGLPGLFLEGVFLTPYWFDLEVPLIGKVGTPLVFDLGVYLVVLSVAASILLDLMEE